MQLGAPCYFAPTEDGALRCVPLHAACIQPYHSDPACTQPLALASMCTTPTAVASGASCGMTYAQLGGAHVGAVYYLQGTTCRSIATPTNVRLYRVGASLPLGSFAAATISNWGPHRGMGAPPRLKATR